MLFDIFCYAIAIVGVLTLYGSQPEQSQSQPEVSVLSQEQHVASQEKPQLKLLPAAQELVQEAASTQEKVETYSKVEKVASQPSYVQPSYAAAGLLPAIASVSIAIEPEVQPQPEVEVNYDSMGRDQLRAACKAHGIVWSHAGTNAKHLTVHAMRELLKAL